MSASKPYTLTIRSAQTDCINRAKFEQQYITKSCPRASDSRQRIILPYNGIVIRIRRHLWNRFKA